MILVGDVPDDVLTAGCVVDGLVLFADDVEAGVAAEVFFFIRDEERVLDG